MSNARLFRYANYVTLASASLIVAALGSLVFTLATSSAATLAAPAAVVTILFGPPLCMATGICGVQAGRKKTRKWARLYFAGLIAVTLVQVVSAVVVLAGGEGASEEALNEQCDEQKLDEARCDAFKKFTWASLVAVPFIICCCCSSCLHCGWTLMKAANVSEYNRMTDLSNLDDGLLDDDDDDLMGDVNDTL